MNHSALIYCHSVSPRLQYIVDFLSQYFGLSFKIIYDEEKYIAAEGKCKINYGYHRLADGEIFIHSHALLFESSVHPVKIECFEIRSNLQNENKCKAFFKAEGDVGFDILAAIFYLITRYEEYLPYKKDSYGRYAHQNSTAFKEGFLDLPLVNIWLEEFRKLLAEKNSEFNPEISGPISTFSFLPTYDIDMAWSFKNKGFKRNAGAIFLLLIKARFKKIIHRIKVVRRKKEDPFDAYNWMDDLHEKHKLKPVYFFLMAKDKGRYDKNIDINNFEFQLLIKTIAEKNIVGIHPSWASGDMPALLTKEIAALEELTHIKIDLSRQHYIRFQLPATYQRLLSFRITNDYSMGYGSINGFRASIATPFYWYDLKGEEKTELLIHPFCFMDANSYFEQKLSAEEAFKEMMQYYSVIKSVNGTMITIWHNSFLGTAPEFKGWKEVYEKFVANVAAI